MTSSSAQTLQGLAKDLGLGRVLLRYYYGPIGRVRLSVAAGGPFQRRLTEKGRLEMVEAAKTLPPLDVAEDGAPFEIHFLTGRKYWYQTLFCAWSMQINCTSRVTPTIYDDGTLTKEDAEYISHAIPWARFVWISEIETLLDAALPASRFPELRRRRLIYPHLRKITDIHFGKHGWTLVLDSDMLFFPRAASSLRVAGSTRQSAAHARCRTSLWLLGPADDGARRRSGP